MQWDTIFVLAKFGLPQVLSIKEAMSALQDPL
jgi:hypothetical protein